MCEGRGANLNDIDNDIMAGEISDQSLKQLNLMIGSVFIPLVRSMNPNHDGRECDDEEKKEFITVTNKFSD